MATTMTRGTTESWRLGIPDEAWSFRTLPPGERDLGEGELWERSLVRSQLRRESAAARKVGIRQGARGRLAVALVGVTLAVPATEAVTAQTANATMVSGPADSSGGMLRRGARGELVRQVQTKVGVSADGVFGRQTVRAVRAYQRSNGLEVDGIVGPATAGSLGITLGSGVASSRATTTDAGSASASTGSGSGRSAAISAAQSKIGASYSWGATGPSTFDCSGLTQWAMAKAGVSLPRTSQEQYQVGTRVSPGAVRAGDLVFFSTDGAGATHVGIALSGSTAISATSHGVMEHSFTSGYWGNAYLGARRV